VTVANNSVAFCLETEVESRHSRYLWSWNC